MVTTLYSLFLLLPHHPFLILLFWAPASCPFPFLRPTCLSLIWSLLSLLCHYDQPGSTGQAQRQLRVDWTKVFRSKHPSLCSWAFQGLPWKRAEGIAGSQLCFREMPPWQVDMILSPSSTPAWQIEEMEECKEGQPPRCGSFIRSLVISDPFKWNTKIPRSTTIHSDCTCSSH